MKSSGSTISGDLCSSGNTITFTLSPVCPDKSVIYFSVAACPASSKSSDKTMSFISYSLKSSTCSSVREVDPIPTTLSIPFNTIVMVSIYDSVIIKGGTAFLALSKLNNILDLL